MYTEKRTDMQPDGVAGDVVILDVGTTTGTVGLGVTTDPDPDPESPDPVDASYSVFNGMNMVVQWD